LGQIDSSPHLKLARTFYREAYSIACTTRGQIVANQMMVPLVLKSSNDFRKVADIVRQEPSRHFDLIQTNSIVKALARQHPGHQGIVIPIEDPIVRLGLATRFCAEEKLTAAPNLSVIKKAADWPERITPDCIQAMQSQIQALIQRHSPQTAFPF